jgi:hypothetical protein
MLACNEVTRLWASEEIRRAALGRRLAVRFHLLMCSHCSRYVQELRLIGAAVRDEFRRGPDRARMVKLELTVGKQLRAEVENRGPNPEA